MLLTTVDSTFQMMSSPYYLQTIVVYANFVAACVVNLTQNFAVPAMSSTKLTSYIERTAEVKHEKHFGFTN